MGVALKVAEDTILREYLVSVCSQYNCQGGSNGDNPSDPAFSDFATLNSQLDTANAMKFVSGQGGQNKIGSAPIRSAFFIFAHTLLERTFDGLQGFTNVWNYPSQNQAMYSEYGAFLNFRLLTSSNSSISLGASALGAQVYNNITCGKESYAHIQQDGYSARLIYRDPIYSGPLALNGTLGLKFAQAQIVEQETYLSNFRCTDAL